MGRPRDVIKDAADSSGRLIGVGDERTVYCIHTYISCTNASQQEKNEEGSRVMGKGGDVQLSLNLSPDPRFIRLIENKCACHTRSASRLSVYTSRPREC